MGCGNSAEVNWNAQEALDKDKRQGHQQPTRKSKEEEDPLAVREDTQFEYDQIVENQVAGKRTNKFGKQMLLYKRREPKQNSVIWEQISPENTPEVVYEQPNVNLKLKYLFGYNSSFSRQNIHYSATNEIVYPAAAVGVIHNIATNTQRFLQCENGHYGEISALKITKNKDLAATGDISWEPKVIIWNLYNLEANCIIKLPKESIGISWLSFDWMGELIAAVDMQQSPALGIWECLDGNWTFTWKIGECRIFDMWFSPKGTLVTCGMKHIEFWSLPNYTRQFGHWGQTGKIVNLTCACWITSDIAVTGGTNGALYVWKDSKWIKQMPLHANRYAIHTLMIQDNFIYSGGSDDRLYILNNKLNKVSQHQLKDTPKSVTKQGWSIIVGLEKGEIVEIQGSQQKQVMKLQTEQIKAMVEVEDGKMITSGEDGFNIWDMTQRKSIYYEEDWLENKTTCISIDRKTKRIVFGYDNGSISIRASIDQLDEQVFNESLWWNKPITQLCFSNCGRRLAAASLQDLVVIGTQTNKLSSSRYPHKGNIMFIEWSNKGTSLRVLDSKNTTTYWKIRKDLTLKKRSSRKASQKWVSDTVEPNNGLNQKLVTTRQGDGRFIASGDSCGDIRIYNNPVGPQFVNLRWHGSHVTHLSWNSKSLYTVGGFDPTLAIWKPI